jgi:hypothetical protein
VAHVPGAEDRHALDVVELHTATVGTVMVERFHLPNGKPAVSLSGERHGGRSDRRRDQNRRVAPARTLPRWTTESRRPCARPPGRSATATAT